MFWHSDSCNRFPIHLKRIQLGKFSQTHNYRNELKLVLLLLLKNSNFILWNIVRQLIRTLSSAWYFERVKEISVKKKIFAEFRWLIPLQKHTRTLRTWYFLSCCWHHRRRYRHRRNHHRYLVFLFLPLHLSLLLLPQKSFSLLSFFRSNERSGDTVRQCVWHQREISFVLPLGA